MSYANLKKSYVGDTLVIVDKHIFARGGYALKCSLLFPINRTFYLLSFFPSIRHFHSVILSDFFFFFFT